MRDHGGIAARQQVLRGAVAQIARVLHVERDRIGAPQLIADILRGDRRLDAEVAQPLLHLGLENLAEVDLGEPEVAVGVALHLGESLEIAERDVEDQAFGDDRDAVPASFASRLMIAPTRVSTMVWRRIGGRNSSVMSVSVAPADLPMPSARWPALRPIAMTKYQRDVVLASTIRFFTISTP